MSDNVEVTQDNSGILVKWDGREKVDIKDGTTNTGPSESLWKSNEIGQPMGRAATPGPALGGSSVSGEGWNSMDPASSGFEATPITKQYFMTSKRGNQPGPGTGMLMDLTFAPLRNANNTKATNTLVFLNKIINYGSGYAVGDTLSCDDWDDNFVDSADRIFKITAVTEVPTGTLKADGNDSDITITPGEAVVLEWDGNPKIDNFPPAGKIRAWKGRFKVRIDTGFAEPNNGYWESNFCLYPMGRAATPMSVYNGSDDSYTGWQLRQGGTQFDGFGANPISGKYDLVYGDNSSGNGSGARMKIRFDPLKNNSNNNATNTKITIERVLKNGSGYAVDDVLTTSDWDNNFYNSASRIIKVTEVTPDPNDDVDYELKIQGGSNIVSSPGNSGTVTLDPGPTTTTTYSYNVEGPGGKIKVKRKIIVQAAPGEPTASINAADTLVTQGSCTLLSWSSSNGVSYTLEDSNGNTIDSDPGASNTGFQVCPEVGTTYVYTVTGAPGTTPATDEVFVGVNNLPPESPTASLTATPTSFTRGDPNGSTLTWSSTNGSTYTLTTAGLTPVIDNPGPSNPPGGVTVTPDQTTTYIYTVFGPGGQVSDNAEVSVLAQPTPVASLTASHETIVRGEGGQDGAGGVKLTWESSNGTSYTLTDVDNPGADGDAIVYPTTTKTYYYVVSNVDGSGQDEVTITVYEPIKVTITPSALSMTAGTSDSIYVEWSTTGDADTLVWTSTTEYTITNTNLSSNTTIAPQVTTTYSAYATGLAGTSPLATFTITVNSPPTLEVDYPTSINYNEQAEIEYTSNFVNSSLTLTPTYFYLQDNTVDGDDVALSYGNSAVAGVGNTQVTDDYTTTIPYTNQGPYAVSFYITGSGSGGGVNSTSGAIPINIDMTPENIEIEDSEDLLIEQDPVITPDTPVLTSRYLIDDIDVAVEIKSNKPIQVQVNNNPFENVREIS